MQQSKAVFVCLLLGVVGWCACDTLKISAFNIRIFGKSKLQNEDVVATLVRIVHRYDIILIQEIRDSSHTVIYSFLEQVNTNSSSTNVTYAVDVSERLGRSRSKEQYAFMYRADRVEIVRTFQYNDSANDHFEREPYSVLIRSREEGGLPQFFLVGIHTKPSKAFEEINALVDVYDEAVSHYGTENGIILGNFNADCSYLSQKRYMLELVTDSWFIWLLDTDVDTTTKNSDCAYDRIVVAGSISDHVVINSSRVFLFDQEYQLSQEEAEGVSDHYPVEFQLQGDTLHPPTLQPPYLGPVLKISAFNIQIFGQSKFKKEDAVATLVQIVRRYDIILIQEIRDASRTVIYSFLERVNANSSVTYAVNVSERLGRSNNKEQYAFMYRTDGVEIVGTFQYNDSANDHFEREPYSVLIRSREEEGLPQFFLVGIHTKPSKAFSEINALVDVYDEAVNHYGTANGIILGDFNADCSYLSQKRYNKLELVTDSRFTWLLDNDVDTTTKNSNCAYDRIVVAGSISDHVVMNSSRVFLFDQEYRLSQEQAEVVSDHYPVEFQLQGNTGGTITPSAGDTLRPRTLQPSYLGPVLKISAFNIQIFGQSKFKKEDVVATLVQIVRRYDIILIQEIRDASRTVIYSFLERVNANSSVTYAVNVSERLGRSNNKEQYAFMYRTDRVETVRTFQYNDSANDHFEREPYSVLIRSREEGAGLPQFFLVGIHTKPSKAFDEINALVDVYDEAVSHYGTENGIILGDFNADCSYLSQKRYNMLELVTDSRFTWLLDTDADTTTKNSNCAYDRIVVAGSISDHVVMNSSRVFLFDQEYGLSQEQAEVVSDHYPVEFQLQGNTGGTMTPSAGDTLCPPTSQPPYLGPVLKISAFNIQIFGQSKFKKEDVVATLVQIVRRYDIILIQEIRDASRTVIYSFLEQVNANSSVTYAVNVSERLGRSNNKEQYAFMYRTDRVETVRAFQYNDSANDHFEREPYSVLIRSREEGAGLPQFFLVGIHTKPSKAFDEINALVDVYDEAVSHYGTENGIILGDFNADCSYLSQKRYNMLELVTDSRFTWLLDTDADTTTKNSNCAYDRIVVAGSISDHVVINSSRVFLFDQEYRLSQEQAEVVSDHYPVEFQLQGNTGGTITLSAGDTLHPPTLQPPYPGPVLKISAFNIQIFGQSKFRKEDVVATLVQIVRRYDIILIQEIRDASRTVIYSFLERVNANSSVTYAVNVSERLGRSNNKEQYAFMYRTDRVETVRTFQYNDSASDHFEREPYSVLIRSREEGRGLPQFFLVGIHTKPSKAFEEINALVDVYDEAVSHYGTENGIILGDFNADCSYLSQKRYNKLELVTDSRFTWLLDTDVDTTTKNSDCAYDRIVVAGSISDHVVMNSSRVFLFDQEYGLSQEQAQDVSDHYPVELKLQAERLQSQHS